MGARLPVVFAVSRASIDLLVDAGDDATVDDPVRALAGGEVGGGIELTVDGRHAHGVLHLGVKPANVLFAGDSRVLLADSGGHTRGTAGFAAPEVERGDATVDERADVYGVGALLAAMLGPGPSALAPVVTRAMATDPPIAPRP